MGKPILTERNKQYIQHNRFEMSSVDMADKIGCSRSVVQRYMRVADLRVPMEFTLKFRSLKMTGRTTSTPKMDRFLHKHYLTTPVNRMAEMIGKSGVFVSKRLQQLNLIQPRELKEKFKQDSRIKPGATPPNKGKKQSEFMSAEAIERSKVGRFQKGHLPHNAVSYKDGDIVTRNSHKNRNDPPYKWIRISKSNWKMLHVHNWEKVNGPVSKGCIIVFKNKDTMKCEIDNLEMITRKENMQRNSYHNNYPKELASIIQLTGALKRKINRKLKNLQHEK